MFLPSGALRPSYEDFSLYHAFRLPGMSASSKWQAPYNKLSALHVIPLAPCYQRALTNADAKLLSFSVLNLAASE